MPGEGSRGPGRTPTGGVTIWRTTPNQRWAGRPCVGAGTVTLALRCRVPGKLILDAMLEVERGEGEEKLYLLSQFIINYVFVKCLTFLQAIAMVCVLF